MASPALAQNASRELPNGYVAGGPAIDVPIAINAPVGTTAVGVEDQPPTDWPVSNISDSGSFDTQTGKIKWGPFFAPSIPALVTYDVTPPAGTSGPQCFVGVASFDGQDEPISGDTCMLSTIPAVSFWGVAAMVGLILTGGTLALRRSPASRAARRRRARC
ncbi:MAG: hypothetical protein HY763_11470 [Planctomycetes bacterium]|nr:hypothetical protein [Planctomycetota bacterium]